MIFQKYMNRAFMIFVLCLSVLVISYGANAAQKSRSALQTDLDNNKLDTYAPELLNADLTTLNDSAFNLTTDSITDISSMNATAVELNKIADDSARIVNISADTTLTCALNGTGFINYVSAASGTVNVTMTAPIATGTGCEFAFAWENAPNSASGETGDIIQVTGNDSFNGLFEMAQDGGDTFIAFETASDTDLLTFSSTTGGAVAFVRFSFQDVATDKFLITDSALIGTGTEATPGATGQRP